MKIAVLADIHSNLPALRRVIADLAAWSPDRVIVAGDIVNRGPHPRECLELVLDKKDREGWQVIRGNHEDFVLRERDMNGSRPDWERAVCLHSAWTYDKIRAYDRALESLPDRIDLEGPDRRPITILHGSTGGNRDGLVPRMDDEQMGGKIDPAASLFCVGHTHMPFARTIGRTLVVNAGAAGLPFDRDDRACYVRVSWDQGAWASEIIRLAYDKQATADAYHTSGFLAEGGPMVSLIQDELRHAWPWLSRWHKTWEGAVSRGEISVEESVARLLASPRDATPRAQA